MPNHAKEYSFDVIEFTMHANESCFDQFDFGKTLINESLQTLLNLCPEQNK